MFFRILTAVLLPTLVIVVLAGAGCKKTTTLETPGGEVEITTDGTSVVVEDQDSEAALSFGTGVKLPDDFPGDAPTYPNGTLISVSDYSDESSNTVHSASWTTSASVDDVEDWYRTELKNQGWSIDASVTTNGVLSLGANKGIRMLTVSVSSLEGVTTISLVVTAQ